MSESKQQVRSDFSITDVLSKTKSFVYTWKINNFRQLYDQDESCIATSTPSHEGKDDTKLWSIKLYMNGHPNYSNSTVHLGADVNFDARAAEITYDYLKFYVYTIDKSKNEHKVYESKKGKTSSTVLRCCIIPCLLKRDFILAEDNGVLPDGNLTLKFEVILIKSNIVHNNLTPANFLPCSSRPSLIEFEEVLDSEKFSDARIVVAGGREFRVHKVILATRSPVFAAMFEHDMRESKENAIEIGDTDEEIVQEMLRFIYTGKVKDIEAVAFDLLAAANKYELKQLKLMCEETLMGQLKVDNVTMLLMQAEAHAAETLKSSAVQFFKLHAKEIVQTKSFEADFHSLMKLLPSIFKSLILEQGI